MVFFLHPAYDFFCIYVTSSFHTYSDLMSEKLHQWTQGIKIWCNILPNSSSDPWIMVKMYSRKASNNQILGVKVLKHPSSCMRNSLWEWGLHVFNLSLSVRGAKHGLWVQFPTLQPQWVWDVFCVGCVLNGSPATTKDFGWN